ncbi:TetR/AcrR family transcriptional regulator [Bordetella petrii]|uniref:TetR/AcrR family transcriptional regulator n=1 Tax=Bordetella petrii TaxID=94624 RepID=UPI001E4A141C|nr:TetR/AcrR family transcriptional regulator [Bordetella petrii]MCD0501613.1 TetR family transcriptional regulator [Bordetella petrii]
MPALEDSDTRNSPRRQAILAAAKELVARKGPNGTTVRDITAASGANGAAVNYYFQSKDGLVDLAHREITGNVNQERLARLDALELRAKGKPLKPRSILAALIEPILTMSRSADGGSLYVRSVFQMRIDTRAGYDTFGLNQHVPRRFVDAIAKAFPGLTREEAIWHYEFARGSAIHMLANLDPLSRRFELLGREPGQALPDSPAYELDQAQIDRVITMIMPGFGKRSGKA